MSNTERMVCFAYTSNEEHRVSTTNNICSRNPSKVFVRLIFAVKYWEWNAKQGFSKAISNYQNSNYTLNGHIPTNTLRDYKLGKRRKWNIF